MERSQAAGLCLRAVNYYTDSLLRGWMPGSGVKWPRADYVRTIGVALLDYAELAMLTPTKRGGSPQGRGKPGRYV